MLFAFTFLVALAAAGKVCPPVNTYLTPQTTGQGGGVLSALDLGRVTQIEWGWLTSHGGVTIRKVRGTCGMKENIGSRTDNQCDTVNLADGEFIVKATVWSGPCQGCGFAGFDYVRKIRFRSNLDNIYDCDATPKGVGPEDVANMAEFDQTYVQREKATHFEGQELVGFTGRAGWIIDAIGFQFRVVCGNRDGGIEFRNDSPVCRCEGDRVADDLPCDPNDSGRPRCGCGRENKWYRRKEDDCVKKQDCYRD